MQEILKEKDLFTQYDSMTTRVHGSQEILGFIKD